MNKPMWINNFRDLPIIPETKRFYKGSQMTEEQTQQNNIDIHIDSLISTKTTKPFNGVILVSQQGKTKYSKIVGYSDINKKERLKLNDQFVIGSISKLKGRHNNYRADFQNDQTFDFQTNYQPRLSL